MCGELPGWWLHALLMVCRTNCRPDDGVVQSAVHHTKSASYLPVAIAYRSKRLLLGFGKYFKIQTRFFLEFQKF